jgi:hypothetical protein
MTAEQAIADGAGQQQGGHDRGRLEHLREEVGNADPRRRPGQGLLFHGSAVQHCLVQQQGGLFQNGRDIGHEPCGKITVHYPVVE